MLSVLMLLGLIPAGLLLAGEGDTKDPSDEEDEKGVSDTGTGATTPLHQALPEPPPSQADAAPGQPVWPSDPDAGTSLDPSAPPDQNGAGSQDPSSPGSGAPPNALDQTDVPAGLDPIPADAPGPLSPEPATTSPQLDEEAPAQPAPPPSELGEDAPEGDDPNETGDTGRDLMLGPEDGDTTIADFRPGADVLDIEVNDREVIGFRSLDPQTGDAQLRLYGAEGEQVITFAGLSQVPVDDIFLLLTDPETGDALSLALAEFLFDEDDALDPILPDEPSVITPPDEDTPGLDPLPAETPPVSAESAPSAAEEPPSPQNEAVAQPDDRVSDSLLIEAQAASTPTRAA